MSHSFQHPAGGLRGDIYSEITSKIVAQIEAGVLPWVQPWAGGPALSLPKNASTKKAYSGVNILLLWDALFARGFERNQWLTFKQALSLGGMVRKGETGTTAVYADSFVPKKEQEAASASGEDARRVAFLKRFILFNIAQCDGLPADLFIPLGPVSDMDPLPVAEALLSASGATIQRGGEQAYYHTGEDFIRIPEQAQFFAPINFYRTALHELTHNAAIRTMPHDLRWRLDCPTSAMRLFGIIRAPLGMRGVGRRAGSDPTVWLARRRERAPSPSCAYRRGCKSAWSRRSRDQARAQSLPDRRRGGASPSRCCGEAYAA